MKNDLASVLKRVGRTSEALLSTVQGLNLQTLEAFNEAMTEAYHKNGWSRSKGRPAAGAKLKPAPDAVQLYVSALRSAYKLGLDVMGFESLRELRDSVKAAKAAADPDQKPERAPELKGVLISAENKMNGGFWHDKLVLWEHFPKERQSQVMQELDEIMRRIAAELGMEQPTV